MKTQIIFFLTFSILISNLFAQKTQNDSVKVIPQGHYNTSKFKQLQEELPTPNAYRTASGAPGFAYYQQQADYVMNITLDDKNQRIYGEATVTYTNNSPDVLDYLWVQLDQNIQKPNSLSKMTNGDGPAMGYQPQRFVEEFMGKPYDGGFKLEYVKDASGKDLSYTINETMMRINLDKPLASKSQMVFKMKWWYNINNYLIHRARSGYEHFDKDGNNLYIIAQFFPRMAVYNDVDGWQTMQFLGTGEFTLVFGNYDVKITTPADHIMEATGELQNPKEVFTPLQYKRYMAAQKSYDKPVIVVTQAEAQASEKSFSDKTKTWHFKAKNVRDFAFATSRKFIYDAQAVKLESKTVMAISLYPKEGNPLWEQVSTKVVAHTLKFYSAYTFDYPYPKAVSVHANQQGMEYPMICFNGGRPKEDGTWSKQTYNGTVAVIIHEVGHNWFPMIVNSDERQWGWMDEGLNTFVQLLAQEDFEPGFPSRGYPKDIVEYMMGDQSNLEPIMTQHDLVRDSGKNAYHKPAAGLYMLREFIMGHDLFDHAFKTYANRWKFKHPNVADFFRTMEDASAIDLDWFWRGWFYTTDVNDIGIKEVNKFVLTDEPTARLKRMAAAYGMPVEQFPRMIHLVGNNSADYKSEYENNNNPVENFQILKDYLNKNFTKEEQAQLKNVKYFYEIVFEKPGGLVMPILVDIVYVDGTKESYNFPALIWRLKENKVSKVFPSDKEIKEIIIDPREITADVNLENNYWPKRAVKDKFEEFKARN